MVSRLVLFSLWAVIGWSSGSVFEDLSNPRNEETNYSHICDTLNVTINFSGLYLNRIEMNFLSSPLITCLNLSNNNIEHFDSDALINLPELKFIDISNNKIKLNESFSIRNPNNLEVLILDDNEASSQLFVYNGMYYVSGVRLQTVYPRLKKLFLRNSRSDVTFIPDAKQVINYFPSLTHLYLTSSKITDADFNWLPSTLEYLDLSGHSLSSLTLTNLDNLKWLFLDNPIRNGLSTVELDAKNLKYLSLASNYVKEIHSSTFNTMESLLYLDLSDNNIDYIDSNSFNTMQNLRYLNLSKNHLERIPLYIFDRLRNLQTLVLEKNSITIISKFSDEIKLEELYLNCNNIMDIASGTFAKLRYLEKLYLHDNELTNINKDSFTGLEQLKILRLSNNKISTLPVNWILPLIHLEVLDLSGNAMIDLADLALNDLCPLKNLYLSNQLSYIRSNSLDTVPINVTISLNPDDTFVKKCLWNNKENSRQYG